nr:reverse transcriptase domain-containing protein [Tanacetum cinerariifolium]
MTAKRIDIIDMAREEYSQEVLVDEPLMVELKDLPPHLEYAFLKGDDKLPVIIANDLSMEEKTALITVLKFHKRAIAWKLSDIKVDEPLMVELKDLRPHLEYAFLKGDDKLPVIIANDLSMEEKTALITVLKFHKRAIAWKLSDIKGINPEFCTHKILMEEDFKPAV